MHFMLDTYIYIYIYICVCVCEATFCKCHFLICISRNLFKLWWVWLLSHVMARNRADQCCIIISMVQRRSSERNFTMISQASITKRNLSNHYLCMISLKSPRVQWVNGTTVSVRILFTVHRNKLAIKCIAGCPSNNSGRTLSDGLHPNDS